MSSMIRTLIRPAGLALAFLGAFWAWGDAAGANAPCDPATACFDVVLSPAALIGDIYADGNMIAGGVNNTRLTLTPGAPHLIEVHNIQDPNTPGFNDVFVYADPRAVTLSATAGRVRTATFYPAKVYVKGLLEVTCDPRGRRPTDVVACRPTIDGVTQPDIAARARATYNLTPGAHALHTDLVGDQANNWASTIRDDVITIKAGLSYVQTARLRASFVLKGLLKVSILPRGLLADIYVDGGLVASQSAAAEVFVAPTERRTVEARAVTDPAANGLYTYADVSRSATVGAGGTRFVNLSPKKTWLAGYLAVTCQINGKTATDDVQCAVSSDGEPVGVLAAGQRATFNLPVGAHALSIATTGASADKWNSPVSTTINTLGGRTTYYTARFSLRPAPTAAPLPIPAPGGAPGINHMGTEKVVLADYFMFWDQATFDGSLTWDVPAPGAYNSDDPGVIQRHVAQAQQACLDGFAVHWFGPQEGRTTGNFDQLLAASAGTNLRHAIVIITNSLPGVSEQAIIDAVNHVLANWGQHPNYLRLGGRPVILFTDMPRPWGSEAAALGGWTRIRQAADPNHNAIWMAEGLVTTYNPLFDGLYVYRIDHRDYPQSWLKQPRWANALRAVERRGNLPLGGLYFADTIAPGFDDTRSANAASDLRAPAPPFARDRRNGGYYADTYSVIPQTNGDFLLVKSFNEWIEGTEIEPGASYGDLYLNLTCEYANGYRSR